MKTLITLIALLIIATPAIAEEKEMSDKDRAAYKIMCEGFVEMFSRYDGKPHDMAACVADYKTYTTRIRNINKTYSALEVHKKGGQPTR